MWKDQKYVFHVHSIVVVVAIIMLLFLCKFADADVHQIDTTIYSVNSVKQVWVWVLKQQNSLNIVNYSKIKLSLTSCRGIIDSSEKIKNTGAHAIYS
jgi:hypothetical protein